MTTINLEKRVELLETQYEQLLKMLGGKPPRNAWRNVVGMFSDDPDIQSLHQEARQIRQADRIPGCDEEPAGS